METTENRAGRVLEIPLILSGCCKAGLALAVSLLTHLAIHAALQSMVALPLPHSVHHDPEIPKESGFQWGLFFLHGEECPR